MSNLLVGDFINCRGNWGTEDIQSVGVIEILVTSQPHQSLDDGESVREVPWDMVRKKRVIVVFHDARKDQERWAYSYQIAPLGDDPNHFHSPLYNANWY